MGWRWTKHNYLHMSQATHAVRLPFDYLSSYSADRQLVWAASFTSCISLPFEKRHKQELISKNASDWAYHRLWFVKQALHVLYMYLDN